MQMLVWKLQVACQILISLSECYGTSDGEIEHLIYFNPIYTFSPTLNEFQMEFWNLGHMFNLIWVILDNLKPKQREVSYKIKCCRLKRTNTRSILIIRLIPDRSPPKIELVGGIVQRVLPGCYCVAYQSTQI